MSCCRVQRLGFFEDGLPPPHPSMDLVYHRTTPTNRTSGQFHPRAMGYRHPKDAPAPPQPLAALHTAQSPTTPGTLPEAAPPPRTTILLPSQRMNRLDAHPTRACGTPTSPSNTPTMTIPARVGVLTLLHVLGMTCPMCLTSQRD